LHRAIRTADTAGARAALEQGADPNSRDRHGFSARELARYLDQTNLLQAMGEPFAHNIRFREQGADASTVLSAEQFFERFGFPYLPYLTFDSYRLLLRVRRKCPWLLRYTAFGTEALWLGRWHASEREGAHVAPVCIQWVDEQVGFGLFASQSIKPFTHLAEYTGRVKRWKLWKQNKNPYCFRYPGGWLPGQIYMVDAQEGGNETRFVNHSDTPNCEPATALSNGILHIFFRATRPIQAGEQITINYGKDYWSRRNTPIRFEKLDKIVN